VLSRLRADLAATQKSRADLQSQLKPLKEELEKMKTKAERELKRIEDLTRDKVTLERKLRDREEEIKGKARLVEEVQDEMVSLNLQVNMAEQRSEKLIKENQELVDRWMARMGQEADAMNTASKWT
jgi:chromosome segregation ATPase